MRVLLTQRYIERENGRLIVHQPGDIIDVPHGQLLIDRGKALPAGDMTPKPEPLTDTPPGRRGRPKGK